MNTVISWTICIDGPLKRASITLNALLLHCSFLYTHTRIWQLIHHVSKKTVQNCFCQNSVKFPLILIIFGKEAKIMRIMYYVFQQQAMNLHFLCCCIYCIVWYHWWWPGVIFRVILAIAAFHISNISEITAYTLAVMHLLMNIISGLWF